MKNIAMLVLASSAILMQAAEEQLTQLKINKSSNLFGKNKQITYVNRKKLSYTQFSKSN